MNSLADDYINWLFCVGQCSPRVSMFWYLKWHLLGAVQFVNIKEVSFSNPELVKILLSHVCTTMQIMCVFVVMCVYCCFFTLDAWLRARSQYSEGPATGHLDTGFSWFPCAEKKKLRWFPRFQVATTCFSCSPPDLNLVVTNFMFCIHVK